MISRSQHTDFLPVELAIQRPGVVFRLHIGALGPERQYHRAEVKEAAILPSLRGPYGRALWSLDEDSDRALASMLVPWPQWRPSVTERELDRFLPKPAVAERQRQRIQRLAWAVIQAAAQEAEACRADSDSDSQIRFTTPDIHDWEQQPPSWLAGATAIEALTHLLASRRLRDLAPATRLALGDEPVVPWDAMPMLFANSGISRRISFYVLGPAAPGNTLPDRILPTMLAPLNSVVGRRPHLDYSAPFDPHFCSGPGDAQFAALRNARATASLGRALACAIQDTTPICVLRVGKRYTLFPFGASQRAWDEVIAQPRCVELLRQVTHIYAIEHATTQEEVVPSAAMRLISHDVQFIGNMQAESGTTELLSESTSLDGWTIELSPQPPTLIQEATP